MKILIVTRSFYPDSSPRAHRATELAKEFARTGHEVEVIGPFGRNRECKRVECDNLKITAFSPLPFKLFPHQERGFFTKVTGYFLRRPFALPEIEMVPHIARELKKKAGFDLCISNAVPHAVHWGVALGRKWNEKLCKVWIADNGDPFSGSLVTKPAKYLNIFEKWSFIYADYLTVPFKELKECFPREFHHKIRVIPQGFQFDRESPRRLREPCNPIPMFAYAGVFYTSARNPKWLLDFLTELDLDFKFIIYSDQKRFLRKYFKLLASKIELNAKIPRDQLIKRLSEMDFLVNISPRTSRIKSSKLIDYAISGRPILDIESGPLSRFTKETVMQFLEGRYDRRKCIDLEPYHISTVGKRFIDLAMNANMNDT